CPGQDGEGLLLAAAALEEALVAHAPLGRAAGSHQGRQIEGMAQRARATCGEMLLADERAALAGTRVKACISDDFIDPTEARDIAQLGTEGGGPRWANAGDALQAPAIRLVAQHRLSGRLQVGDLEV